MQAVGLEVLDARDDDGGHVGEGRVLAPVHAHSAPAPALLGVHEAVEARREGHGVERRALGLAHARAPVVQVVQGLTRPSGLDWRRDLKACMPS